MRFDRQKARLPRWFFAGTTFVFCLSFLVTGCGFHLRGAVELPPVMERTYIAGAENQPLYYELKSALLSAGGQVVKTPEAATAVLIIHDEYYGRRVLSVDRFGRASEYELTLRVVFSLNAVDGSSLAGREEVALVRDYRFDPDNVLSAGKQEEILQEEMRQHAVRRILSRLQIGATNPQ